MKQAFPSKAIYLSWFFLLQIVTSSGQNTSASQSINQKLKSLPTQTDSFPKPILYVSDFERLYTPEQTAYLNKLIAGFENATTVQIAVVTLDSSFTDKEHFDDYTLQLARNWV